MNSLEVTSIICSEKIILKLNEVDVLAPMWKAQDGNLIQLTSGSKTLTQWLIVSLTSSNTSIFSCWKKIFIDNRILNCLWNKLLICGHFCTNLQFRNVSLTGTKFSKLIQGFNNCKNYFLWKIPMNFKTVACSISKVEICN